MTESQAAARAAARIDEQAAARADTPVAAAAPPLLIKRLHPDAILPARQTADAAGLDLHACIDAPTVIGPGDIALVSCGFAMAVPRGLEAQVRPRSGLATRHGLSMPNAPGTIDADYRGEVRVPLINLGREPFTVEPGMRIAQMVIAPVVMSEPIEVETLDETARGAGGFGSTGVGAGAADAAGAAGTAR